MGMLPITTSTSDVLFSRINIDDLERPFLLIFAIFGCSAHSKNKLRRNGWRQTDSLRTGTAIGFRESREHYLKFLVIFPNVHYMYDCTFHTQTGCVS